MRRDYANLSKVAADNNLTLDELKSMLDKIIDIDYSQKGYRLRHMQATMLNWNKCEILQSYSTIVAIHVDKYPVDFILEMGKYSMTTSKQVSAFADEVGCSKICRIPLDYDETRAAVRATKKIGKITVDTTKSNWVVSGYFYGDNAKLPEKDFRYWDVFTTDCLYPYIRKLGFKPEQFDIETI